VGENSLGGFKELSEERDNKEDRVSRADLSALHWLHFSCTGATLVLPLITATVPSKQYGFNSPQATCSHRDITGKKV
jgi:hypothetical protein